MKKAFYSAIIFFTAGTLHAQHLHLNIMGGMANYGGDLQARRFTFNQSHAAIAVGASYEIGERFYVRGEYTFTNLSAADSLSPNLSLRTRNLSFKTIMQEASLLGEFDILNIYDHQLVPYIFAGIAVYRYSPYTYDSTGAKTYLRGYRTEGQGLPQYPDRQPYHRTQFNIPIGAGAKLALSDNIRVGLEVSLRNLFTDYLDDVSTNYPDPNLLRPRSASLSYRGDELKPAIPFPGTGAIRGNPSVKDNFYFVMLRFSYRLNFSKDKDSRTIKSRYIDCPPVKQ